MDFVCSKLSSALLHPAGASQSGSRRVFPKVLKSREVFRAPQCPALSSLQAAEARRGAHLLLKCTPLEMPGWPHQRGGRGPAGPSGEHGQLLAPSHRQPFGWCIFSCCCGNCSVSLPLLFPASLNPAREAAAGSIGTGRRENPSPLKLMDLSFLWDSNDSCSEANTRAPNLSPLVDYPLAYPGTCLSLKGGCEV